MNELALAAGLLGLAVSIPALIQCWERKISLNGVTLVLWGLLEVIAAASIFFKGGSNWIMPAVYSAMSFATAFVVAVRLKSFAWHPIEIITAVMVLISTVIWMNVGAVGATIVSTAGVVIACVPQVWDIWRKPQETAIWLWAAYSVVNGLATIAGKDWSITERFYPSCVFLATVVMFLLACRKLIVLHALKKVH